MDLFHYQTGGEAAECFGLQEPPHPELGITMDMSIDLSDVAISDNGSEPNSSAAQGLPAIRTPGQIEKSFGG